MIVTTTSSACDQILVVDVSVGGDDAGTTVVAVLVDDFLELVTNDRALTLRASQNVFEVRDFEFDLGQLVDDLLTLEGGQTTQLHAEDGIGLDLVDVEEFHQSGASDVDGLRRTDQGDDLVQSVEGLDQTAQDVGALLCLAKQVPGTTNDDLELMRRVQTDHLVEAQRARHSVDDGEHVAAEAGLQLGVLVKVVQHDLGNGVTLDGDDDAHADAVRGLVVDVGDATDLGVTNLLRDGSDQVVRVDLVGQLGDDDRGAALGIFFDLDDAAHTNGATAGGVGVLDALSTDDEPVRREVGSLDALHDGREGGFLVRLEVLERPVDGLGNFTQVVRRNVGGHTDGDAVGTVDQKVRDTAGQNRRFLRLAVVVRGEIDCLVVRFRAAFPSRAA